MSKRLEGLVAFVTGAGRGQGRSHAVRMAQEGADVIAVDVCRNIDGVTYDMADEADLKETARLVEATGQRVVARVADVRNMASLAAAVDEGVGELGRLDIVCANAGINIPSSDGTLSEADWLQVIDVNLTGVWRTTTVSVPHILAGGRGGSIILTSSAAGLRGYANIVHYTAAKHGVNGLVKTLALELGPHRIRVNTLNPTQVDTPMIMNEASYKQFSPEAPNPSRDTFAPVSQSMHVLPVPWVDPVDVSNAAVFLASEESRYITGIALPVDAGVLLK
ncbi:mycofactocin-coupled SDR family oxidoreductase [Pseudonocardia sp. RS010]|uniref:mycofactocin-coupled SDR family oxidoreductase n=1 Tax=Pseudonocardia sp. RS010 TaxID=3385979 RepID=UPI0039A14F29